MQNSSSLKHKSTSFELKDKIISVFGITLFWLILGFYQYFDRFSILVDKNAVDAAYEHWPFIRNILITVLLSGLFGGTTLVFIWEKWLRKLAFARALSYIVLCYICLYILLTYLATLSFSSYDPSILIDGSVLKTVVHTLLDLKIVPNFFFWLFVLLLTITFLLIRDNFGSKVFWGFMRGKYFRPKREERIFMFMDLKSATTIAEKLGEEKYFNFLNDTFKTATHGILSTKGEIYQYVGDEIVISWEKESGLKNVNCVNCYFEMVGLLNERSDYFKDKYGVQPEFKAGLHGGFVIAGEMGIVKREIVYSGDVLNTASRIQSLCNEMDAEIILSEFLINLIKHELAEYDIESLGRITLRGKSEELEIFTLQQNYANHDN